MDIDTPQKNVLDSLQFILGPPRKKKKKKKWLSPNKTNLKKFHGNADTNRIGQEIFKASALWADAFYKSKCPSVCRSIRPSVCVLAFEVPFKRLLPPLPEVGCPIFLEILNPWGKVMERSGLGFEIFV